MNESLGIYIHIPFCVRKCAYCAFNSYEVQSKEIKKRYVSAVKQEIEKPGDFSNDIATIFLGGGTPTCLSGESLKGMLQICHTNFNVLDQAEITIECNPGTVDRHNLGILRETGVNRLSFGVQDFHDSFLKKIGRIHTVKIVQESYKMAREVGYQNVNLDLMFGLPEQNIHHFQETIKQAVSLEPEHLSVYGLKVEPGTPLHQWREQGKITLPCDDEQAEMFEWAMDYLKVSGYNHYEISNFAKPGYECVHNQIYWRNEGYIGFGAGAWSFLGGTRWENKEGLEDYIKCMENEQSPVEKHEHIDINTEMTETMIMHLRMRHGISREYFYNRFALNIERVYGDVINDLKTWGLLVEEEGLLHLTSRGVLLGNCVFEKFLL